MGSYGTSLGFPGGSDGKESACNAGDLGDRLNLDTFILSIPCHSIMWKLRETSSCNVPPAVSTEKSYHSGHFQREMLVLPWWLSCKESTGQRRRHWFDLWSRNIPYAVEQLGP